MVWNHLTIKGTFTEESSNLKMNSLCMQLQKDDLSISLTRIISSNDCLEGLHKNRRNVKECGGDSQTPSEAFGGIVPTSCLKIWGRLTWREPGMWAKLESLERREPRINMLKLTEALMSWVPHPHPVDLQVTQHPYQFSSSTNIQTPYQNEYHIPYFRFKLSEKLGEARNLGVRRENNSNIGS